MEHIGIDVHKRESQMCVLGEGGEVVLERRVASQREKLAELLGQRPKARVLLEASTESEWVARCLEELGHVGGHRGARKSGHRSHEGPSPTAVPSGVERGAIARWC